MVTGGERLLHRTEGEHSSTGKTKLQREKSTGREVWRAALQEGAGSAVPRAGSGPWLRAGGRADPTRAVQQQGLFLFGPWSTEQRAPAQRGDCDTFSSPLNPDHSLPSPEHPDCSYTFLINVINGNQSFQLGMKPYE